MARPDPTDGSCEETNLDVTGEVPVKKSYDVQWDVNINAGFSYSLREWPRSGYQHCQSGCHCIRDYNWQVGNLLIKEDRFGEQTHPQMRRHQYTRETRAV
ncbi:laminin subunit alpha-1 isoform X3 [Prionailurus iriomotensis]